MRKLIISLINLYQKGISPMISSKNIHCKFYPTCSEYTKQAVEKYGVIKGGAKGIIRI